MSIHWRLKTYLATKHGIFTATELQKKIVEKTNILISLPTLCRYCHKKPKSIPLATVELICTALNCSLSDFCDVQPMKKSRSKKKKLSYKNTPHSKRVQNSYPDPSHYEL